MKFTKMHGSGNDFVIVNGIEENLDIQLQVERLCDRHYGIGADGIIVILPSEKADCRIRIFNADGSEAEMCGNGIRCAGKYLYEKKLVEKLHQRIETKAGIRDLTLGVHGNIVESVTVDMKSPILYPAEIPVDFPGNRCVMEPLKLKSGESYSVTAVSMGNPHAVIFVEDPDRLEISNVGREIEEHEKFPLRTNVEFVRVVNRREIRMRVWERGVGETYACGTGACAAVVASILNHLTDNEVFVKLKGGKLFVRWDRWKDQVLMTGDAIHVFEGEIKINEKKGTREDV